ncbi:hypothetical protein MIR68_009760 [Amoeboaphelidium protococcarum]|nr:hypothetical protein MIR68_009760 [Amoeboaphelidium protococcarum]
MDTTIFNSSLSAGSKSSKQQQQQFAAAASSKNLSYYFVVVNGKDVPVYELESSLNQQRKSVYQALIYGALDTLDELFNTSTFQRCIERTSLSGENYNIYGYVTPGSALKFLLLTVNADQIQSALSSALGGSGASATDSLRLGGSSSSKNQVKDDDVKQFMQDVHELLIRCMLNPFVDLNSSVQVPVAFYNQLDSKIRLLGKKYL